VADQTQLWAERYERELAGILALQNDVAQQVARALAVKLLPAEQARLAGAKPVDPEVYDLTLKGNPLLVRFTKADIDAAEQHFQRALARTPRAPGPTRDRRGSGVSGGRWAWCPLARPDRR
jgi:hypothetical protein